MAFHFLPFIKGQDYAKMTKRRGITIGFDRAVGLACFVWRKMCHDVVTEEIDIETARSFSPYGAAQDIDIEGLGSIQIIDGY